jgi:hypothetical protein
VKINGSDLLTTGLQIAQGPLEGPVAEVVVRLLCGLWNLTLAFIVLTSSPIQAQTEPLNCLEKPLAMEQSSALLRVLTAHPLPYAVPLITRVGPEKYITTSVLFAEVMDVSPMAVIVNNIDELRHISHTLAGTQILLVLKSASGFTEEKSRKVNAVAKTSNITISLVWLGEGPVPMPLAAIVKDPERSMLRLNELTRIVLEKFCL